MQALMSNYRHIDIGKAAKGLFLPVVFVSIIAMMIVPLPPILLDIFFIMNILIGLVVGMVSLNTYRPLDFSSFPTVILLATIMRLTLNVASTRVVLMNGHTGSDSAGQVIEAFGNFVIGGNYTVGILVFIILIIINIAVITKGAGRVSEVSARFTLDAMPGKQMAIDADLNAGLVTNEEAKERREDIAREADFYGSMDGASKFVKGDAIAGLIILFINIIGGLLIGTMSYNLPFEQAADFYIRLTIGDGLVAQIPSLLLSLATAIIITRVSERHELSVQMASQMAISRAWGPVSAILGVISLIPGMPTGLFLTASGISGFAAWKFKKAEMHEQNETDDPSDKAEEEISNDINISEISETSRIKLEIGYTLTKLLTDGDDSSLISRITGIRKQLSKEFGIVIPKVKVRDNLSIDAQSYRLTLGSMIIGEDKIYPDRYLAINTGSIKLEIPGIKTLDPAFGLEAVWIEEHDRERAKSSGYTIADPCTVIATHLSRLLQMHIEELIGQDEVQELLDNLSEVCPSLVSNLIPKVIPLHMLTQIFKNLLAERIPITDLRRILEAISTQAGKAKDSRELTEIIRPDLGWLLIQNLGSMHAPLKVVTLNAELEQLLTQSLRQSGGDPLGIENGLIQKLASLLSEESEKVIVEERVLVLITTPTLRYPIFKLLRNHLSDFTVLSIKDIPDTKKLEVTSVIGR